MSSNNPGASFTRALTRATPVSVAMKITPEDARYLLKLDAEYKLATDDRNRLLDVKRVSRFADIIRRGEWELTHQGVALSPEGQVTDGQHRLAAIVEAGITVDMAVAQGVFNFAVIDTGKSRTASDALHIAGRVSTTQLAAALKLVAIYDSRAARPWTLERRGFSNQQIVTLAAESQNYIDDCVRQATLISRRIGGSRSSIAAGLYICRRWALDKDLLDEYLEFENGLVTGVGMNDGDARLALANWFVSATGAGSRRIKSGEHRAEISMLLILRSFVAFLRGEVLTRMLISDASTWLYRLPVRAMKETYRGVGVRVVSGALESSDGEEG